MFTGDLGFSSIAPEIFHATLSTIRTSRSACTLSKISVLDSSLSRTSEFPSYAPKLNAPEAWAGAIIAGLREEWREGRW
jgi:hypothetical protein